MYKPSVTNLEKQNTIIKSVDLVNRVHIPALYLRRLGLGTGDNVRVTSTNDSVIITPQTPVCCICGSEQETQKCGEKYLCKSCIKEIAKQKDE